MKKRVLISVLSVLVVATLLIGATFAWFTDVEKTDAGFRAGVLNIELEGYEPLEFTNLRPLTLTQFDDELISGYANRNTEGFDPIPVYFQPVTIENKGTLPARLQLTVRETEPSDQVKNMVDNGDGGIMWDNSMVDCENGLKPVLKIYVYELVGEEWVRVEGVNLNTASLEEGETDIFNPASTLAAKENVTYVIGGHLPESVGNDYQAEHFHSYLYVGAGQTDPDAEIGGPGEVVEPTPTPDIPTPSPTAEPYPVENVEITVNFDDQASDVDPDPTSIYVTFTDDVFDVVAGADVTAPTGYFFSPADQTERSVYDIETGSASEVTFTVEKEAVVTPTPQPDGSEENPYHIYDEATLRAVENEMDAHYIVVEDFSLTRGWNPLGLGDSADVAFTGSIDGQGHTISGLHSVLGDYSNVGLFAINNGTIENLNLSINEIEGWSEVGAVAGTNDQNGIISDVHVTGKYVGALSDGSNGGFAGGIAGRNRGTIQYSSSRIGVGSYSGNAYGVVAYNYAGGIAGGNWGVIKESYATGGINSGYYSAINSGQLSTYYAGGLVGGNLGTIEDCYVNLEALVVGYQRVGGFLGWNGSSGIVRRCYVVHNDKAWGSVQAAISIGYNIGSVSNSYAESTTSGSVNGFTRITRANLTNGNTLSGFSTSVWNFAAGRYPDLVNNPR